MKTTTLKTEVATVTLSHRQTVKSLYLPNSGRIRVVCNGGMVKHYPYRPTLEPAENHAQAIQEFLNFMEWEGVGTIGASVDLTGYVAVWTGHKG